MLDPDQAAWADAHVQSFAVRYEYPVHFTRDLFDPANPCLAAVLMRREPDKRHRLAVFLDDGLTLAAPGLPARIARYVAAHKLDLGHTQVKLSVTVSVATIMPGDSVEEVLRRAARNRERVKEF